MSHLVLNLPHFGVHFFFHFFHFFLCLDLIFSEFLSHIILDLSHFDLVLPKLLSDPAPRLTYLVLDIVHIHTIIRSLDSIFLITQPNFLLDIILLLLYPPLADAVHLEALSLALLGPGRQRLFTKVGGGTLQ